MRQTDGVPGTGLFITLEGGEGAGKTTQRHFLGAALKAVGLDTLVTREPGGNPQAEALRAMLLTGDVDRWTPMTEALLMTAARTEHVVRTIKPALQAGRCVLCDRFSDSTIAYQGAGHGLGMGAMRSLQETAFGRFRPDLTLILDLPVKTGLTRARSRETARSDAEDRFENMDVAFHERLRAAFLEIADLEPDRCAVISADGTPQEVFDRLWDAVADRLPVRDLLPEARAEALAAGREHGNG
ncbi:dTMP kinase [Yunchengibacter salinarum]|uniref:dTMP kinase n=1 Tax=Yunchengibacter salinarum TaxID=3133399 RepID=UPI0035B6429E